MNSNKGYRFAKIRWSPYIKEYIDNENARTNLGDLFQCIAIEQLYRRIGFSGELIEIGLDELKTYAGEDCILPLHIGLSSNNIYDYLPVSSHIRPVFFAITVIIDVFMEFPEFISYFKKYEPIGCRDERTYQIFTRYGIKAYIVGCTTFALNDNYIRKKRSKYYLIDIPQSLKKFLSKEIVDNAVEVCHEIPLFKYPMDLQEYDRVYQYAEAQLNTYGCFAKCIITTRLHGILPALAFGIPVIAVSNNIDYRFSFVDKYIKVYIPDEFKDINWDVKAIDVHEARCLVEKCFKEIIHNGESGYCFCETSTNFYQNRMRLPYNLYLVSVLDLIETLFARQKAFSYVIWGCGIHGFLAYEMMSKRFPNATLSFIVDKYENGSMFGKKIITGEQLNQYDFDLVLVTTSSGKKEAEKYLKNAGKHKNRDYFLFYSKEMRENSEED